MSTPNLILTLAKVLIAAAWADGEIQIEEINSLKDLLFRLPEITGREWAMLEMYIESPIGEAERALLVEQLQAEMRTRKDKALALGALNDLIQADGTVTEQEKEVVQNIQGAIEEANVGLFKQIGGLLSGPVQRRTLATSEAPNREDHFEDYIKNKVYYGLEQRLKKEDVRLDIPEQNLRKLCLAGGLMAHVAQVDREVTEGEIKFMQDILSKDWGLNPDEAAFVADVAVSEISPTMDYYRLTRQFFMNTSEEERIRFLDVLFGVAAADGLATSEEIEEIRSLTMSLKLTHKHFINAKIKIPRERRAG